MVFALALQGFKGLRLASSASRKVKSFAPSTSGRIGEKSKDIVWLSSDRREWDGFDWILTGSGIFSA